jgi:hypothetical protein
MPGGSEKVAREYRMALPARPRKNRGAPAHNPGQSLHLPSFSCSFSLRDGALSASLGEELMGAAGPQTPLQFTRNDGKSHRDHENRLVQAATFGGRARRVARGIAPGSQVALSLRAPLRGGGDQAGLRTQGSGRAGAAAAGHSGTQELVFGSGYSGYEEAETQAHGALEPTRAHVEILASGVGSIPPRSRLDSNGGGVSRANGPQGLREELRNLRKAFAGFRFEPLDIVAEGDRVVVCAHVHWASRDDLGAMRQLGVVG